MGFDRLPRLTVAAWVLLFLYGSIRIPLALLDWMALSLPVAGQSAVFTAAMIGTLALPFFALWVQPQAEAFATKFDCPIGPLRLFVIRPPADEASAAMVFGQFLSWMTNKAAIVLSLITVPSLLLLVTADATGWFWLASVAENALFASAFMVALPFIAITFNLPFGLRSLWFLPFIEVSSESAPAGYSTILQLGSSENQRSWLRHSSTHEHDEAANAVCEFLFGNRKERGVRH